jgi:hypothetical protein
VLVLLVAVAVGLWAGAVAGGRLGNVQYLRLTQAWLVLVALAIQLVVFSPLSAPLGAHVVVSLHLLSYALLLAFALLNRHNVGVLITAAGVACNALAIALNGGYMPATRGALRTAGHLYAGDTSNNSRLAEHGARLLFLSDVLAVPHALPLANVFSIGDVLVAGGVAILLAGAMIAQPQD